MKPVFKCEYCNYMSTEEKVKEHEATCRDNYDRRSCFTCKHKTMKNLTQYKCDLGTEIPDGQIFEFCPQYERKEKYGTQEDAVSDIFGAMFGGI